MSMCKHQRKRVKTTYLGKKEEGGKLASVTKHCADCGAFIMHGDKPEAYFTGNHYSYVEVE